ncbi:MAG TPA: aminotransferase class V-fold PLP-dependent enzyme [Bacteroidales bacterium]|nr:aminotransferase class V-fold PLP-dependent enzyme [Bacteroidales bacterium]
MPLDLDFIRSQFPALDGNWIYFDNAGGTQTARQVGERLTDYLFHTNVQLGASYRISELAGQRVKDAQAAWAKWIHAQDPSEIIFGPSTTQLLQNLSKSFSLAFQPGDEVIVTNCDHEANIGPWRYLERFGIIVKEWKISPDDFRLHTESLQPLLTERTRLVAFTHVSNILGTINPVRELTAFIHEHGAMVCVDGVAYAPHRSINVTDWDVDFYVFSLYKVYGPHYSLLYGKRKHLEALPGINHFFIQEDEIPYKLQPGNVNFELTFSLTGILDYFNLAASHHNGMNSVNTCFPDAVLFDQLARQEEELAALLLDFLSSQSGIRIIGEKTSDRFLRVPTISFISEKIRSDRAVVQVDPHRIGIRYGDFYAHRLIRDLGLQERKGVIRVSMVHYNTVGEVRKLIGAFERIL